MSGLTRSAACGLVLLAIATSAGCLADSIFDEISTELTITNVGEPGAVIEIRKRFRFSYDPMSARGVYFRDGTVQVLDPADRDLSWIHSIEIYAIDAEGSLTLVASGDGFRPGDRLARLQIDYEGDLRGFALDDSRVMFSFVVRPAAWSRPFPDGGVTVLTGASIEIDI